MNSKNELGTLEEITDETLTKVTSVEVAVDGGVSYVVLPDQSGREGSMLRILDARDLSLVADCELPELSERGLILGTVRYDEQADTIVLARHFWDGHGGFGLSKWDYGFLGTNLSSIIDEIASSLSPN